MHLKKMTVTATFAGTLSAAALGLGAGAALAHPHPDPEPTVPSDTDFDRPPGQVGRDLGIAPGQLKNLEEITVERPGGGTVTIDNPFFGVPPGHWDDSPDDWEDAVNNLPDDEPDVPGDGGDDEG